MPQGKFNVPLDDDDDGVSRSDANKATKRKSVVAGNYIRRTFTWTPKQLDLIDRVAKENGFSKNATARWLLDVGLSSYLDEGVRPELEEKEVRPEPKIKFE